jgi:hypothetical protein
MVSVARAIVFVYGVYLAVCTQRQGSNVIREILFVAKQRGEKADMGPK